jgi:hypothetical protein
LACPSPGLLMKLFSFHLASPGLGKTLAFLLQPPRPGTTRGLSHIEIELDDEDPVVSVTIARLRVKEAVRFIRWGKPVERQVMDNPATTIALAAIRPLRTLSTFSIWQTQRELKQMVHGRRNDDDSQKHAKAMQERNRKDFHHEFITLRFRPLSEHGIWEGSRQLLPTTPR